MKMNNQPTSLITTTKQSNKTFPIPKHTPWAYLNQQDFIFYIVQISFTIFTLLRSFHALAAVFRLFIFVLFEVRVV